MFQTLKAFWKTIYILLSDGPCDRPMPPTAVLRQPGAVLWRLRTMNFNRALNRAPNQLPTFLILHCSVNEDTISGVSRKCVCQPGNSLHIPCICTWTACTLRMEAQPDLKRTQRSCPWEGRLPFFLCEVKSLASTCN